jgi:hypothetical protein
LLWVLFRVPFSPGLGWFVIESVFSLLLLFFLFYCCFFSFAAVFVSFLLLLVRPFSVVVVAVYFWLVGCSFGILFYSRLELEWFLLAVSHLDRDIVDSPALQVIFRFCGPKQCFSYHSVGELTMLLAQKFEDDFFLVRNGRLVDPWI